MHFAIKQMLLALCTFASVSGFAAPFLERHSAAQPRTSAVKLVANSQRTRREQLLRELEAPIEQRAPEGAAEDDPAAPLALAACRAGDARKAYDVTALRVSHLTSATNFFVNMVGRSKAQINAIVKNVEDELQDEFGRRCHRQGKALGGWVCLDYDSVVVNIFSEEQREFYSLDRFWAAAQPLDLSGVLVPNLASEAEVEATSEDEDDWEMDDDWDLGDDDVWSLDDADADSDDVSAVAFDFTPTPEPEGGSAVDEGTAAADEVRASNGALDPEDPFAAFDSEEVMQVEEVPEVVIATAEEEEAAAVAAAERMDRDDDDADWALGDETLRAVVEAAELGASSSLSADDATDESGGAANGPGGWRSMMKEDGWSDEELEAELLSFDIEDDDGDGDAAEDRLLN